MSKALKFRRLCLLNWKNFQRAEVDIADLVFLVGPNASGKSNFLDAFRFLRDLASSGGGFQEAARRQQRLGMAAERRLEVLGVEGLEHRPQRVHHRSFFRFTPQWPLRSTRRCSRKVMMPR